MTTAAGLPSRAKARTTTAAGLTFPATGTTATIAYRTGDTPAPDAAWTPFTAVGTGGTIAGSARYLQFVIQFTSTSSAKTPVIQDVSVVFKR